jgi:hypothetical protein
LGIWPPVAVVGRCARVALLRAACKLHLSVVAPIFTVAPSTPYPCSDTICTTSSLINLAVVFRELQYVVSAAYPERYGVAHSLAVTRGSFLAVAHRKLSVALVQSQGYVYRSCALLLPKASRRQVFPGADLSLIERPVVCTGLACWLWLDLLRLASCF